MKKCMHWLIVSSFFLGMVGCGKQSGPETKEKAVMVIPPGGIPVNPIKQTMPYQWQYQWQK
jgi:hypothetical protein